MSGTSQGLPQRMTAFVDPKTGLVSETWWRFLNSLWTRTGGAQSTASLEDAINYGLMADTPAPEPAEVAALLAALMADTPAEPENDPALVAWMVAD